jgi:hypothetical protein
MRTWTMLLAVCVARAASAADPPTPPPPPPPVTEVFAEKVSALIKEPVDGKAVGPDGLPLGIVKIIEWKHSKERPEQKARGIEFELARWRPIGKKFDDAWAAYQARAAEVKAAVEKSDQALKDGKPDEARKLVEAVITPNKVSDKGQVDVHRALVDARDAEIPALLALGRAAAAQNDYLTVANLAQMMYAHRLVGEESDERLLWIGRQNRKELEGLVLNNDFVPALILRADAEARKLQSLGRGMIKTLFKLGLKEVFLYQPKPVKKGDWIVFQIDPQKVDGKSATFAEHKTYQMPYDCYETNKVMAVDPSDGRIIWEQRCKYRDETVNLDAHIKFAGPPPPWVKPGDLVHFIGRVEKTGPKWIIAEAAVPDWRFIGFAPDDYFIIQR